MEDFKTFPDFNPFLPQEDDLKFHYHPWNRLKFYDS